jgi:hypothetical protein
MNAHGPRPFRESRHPSHVPGSSPLTSLRLPLFLAVGLALLACLPGGCADDEVLTCPDTPVGLIQGYVLGGGRAVADLDIWAEPAGGDSDGDFRTSTDSTGWYSLTVPAGEYLLYSWDENQIFHSRAGMCFEREQADTLTAGHGAVRADFIGGALTVSVVVPEDSATSYTCSVHYLEGAESGEYTSAHEDSEQGTVEFQFSLLPAGTYAIACGPQADHEVWLPPTYDINEADRVVVDAASPTTYAAELLQPALLTLDVQGSWQTLDLFEPSAEAFTSDSVRIDRVYLDAQGTGQFIAHAPLSLRLRVSIGGLARWIGGWTFSEASTFELAPGDSPQQVSYRESAILCTLQGPGPATSFNARYHLYDATGRALTPTFGLHPELERPAPLPNLAPGTYFLRVAPSAEGQLWCEQWFDQSASLASATAIEIPAEGAVVPVTMHLLEGGKISGRVLEWDGSPYAGSVMVWKNDETNRPYRYVQSDGATGNFRAVGLPDGDYLLASFVGYSRMCWYPGTMSRESAVTIQVRNLGEVDGVNWQIP